MALEIPNSFSASWHGYPLGYCVIRNLLLPGCQRLLSALASVFHGKGLPWVLSVVTEKPMYSITHYKSDLDKDKHLTCFRRTVPKGVSILVDLALICEIDP